MKKIVTERIKSTMGGMFYRGILEDYDTIDEGIIDDIVGVDQNSLLIMREFCQALLNPQLSHKQREDYWVEAVTAEFAFKSVVIIELCRFIIDEIDKELKRQRQR